MREPDYESPDGSVRLFLGDAREVLPFLESGSVQPLHNVRPTIHLAAAAIATGDLLLHTGWHLYQRIIAATGRGPYCHAEMAAWLDGELYGLGMVAFRGGRRALLAEQVSARPGMIDWFSCRAADVYFDRQAAVSRMLQFVGQPYGWWSIFRLSLRRMPVVRLCVRTLTDMEHDRYPAFCSQAVAIAARAGGVDPVPRLADRETEPSDLARSLFYRFEGSLVT